MVKIKKLEIHILSLFFIKGKIVSHGKDKKVLVFKKKRRKGLSEKKWS